MKRILVWIVLFCLCPPGIWADDYRYDRNVPYRSVPSDDVYADSLCRLDIAYPADAADAPVVVWFHGGGLTGGNRESPSAVGRRPGCGGSGIPFVSPGGHIRNTG